MWNMALADIPPIRPDFILGWGAFGGPVDKYISTEPVSLDWDGPEPPKTGLCVAGNASAIPTSNMYDVIFYETDWVKDNYLYPVQGKKVHAFGVNTDIYNPWKEAPMIWDFLSVGAFAYWKRQHMILAKNGTKMVVGEIQHENWQESFDIISDLLLGGVGISDMVYPTKLRNLYNCAGVIYIPADVMGGGERAVLEARACSRPVEVENDNPKLQELLHCPVFDHHYYADQLKKGILGCL